MTVFKEVIEAEQESEQTIAMAKEEVVRAIADARSQQRAHLEAEEQKLIYLFNEAKTKREAEVAVLVNKLNDETKVRQSAIKQKFTVKKPELLALIKQKIQG